MCDYSLHCVETRPARKGDKLISHAFNASTTGFAAAENLRVAVCLAPGTEIELDEPVRVRRHRFIRQLSLGFLTERIILASTAKFVKINQHDTDLHHDALEFSDGETVLVTDLVPGNRARVLQLPISHARKASQNGKTAIAAALDVH